MGFMTSSSCRLSKVSPRVASPLMKYKPMSNPIMAKQGKLGIMGCPKLLAKALPNDWVLALSG